MLGVAVAHGARKLVQLRERVRKLVLQTAERRHDVTALGQERLWDGHVLDRRCLLRQRTRGLLPLLLHTI